MKAAIEITTDESADAFQVRALLAKIRGISKVHIVSAQCTRIYYHPLQIPAKKILKLVGTIGRKDSRKRLTNVVSVVEFKQL